MRSSPTLHLEASELTLERERWMLRAWRLAVRVPSLGLIALVRIYQRVLSPAWPVIFGPTCGCRFHPTCSHYAVEALATHGAFYGMWLGATRLLKCHPLHPGGLDPVPPVRARVRSGGPACARVSA